MTSPAGNSLKKPDALVEELLKLSPPREGEEPSYDELASKIAQVVPKHFKSEPAPASRAGDWEFPLSLSLGHFDIDTPSNNFPDFSSRLTEEREAEGSSWYELTQAIVFNRFEDADAIVDAKPVLMHRVQKNETYGPGSSRTVTYDTALGLAAMYNRADMIRTFLKAGASPTLVPGHEPRSYPLYLAMMNDKAEAAQMLLQAGASTNIQVPTESHKTLFAIAINDKKFQIAALMLQYGPDLSSKDAHGETPFQTALASRHPQGPAFIARLVEAGADEPDDLSDHALEALKKRHLIEDGDRSVQFNANVQAAKNAFSMRLAAIRELCVPLLYMPTKHVIEYLS